MQSPKVMTRQEVDAMRPEQVHDTLRAGGVLVDGFPIVLDLDKSEGVWIYDALTGRRLLDGFSFFATQPLGHNHPKIVSDPVFAKSLLRAAQHNPPNADTYTLDYAKYVATFRRVLMPPQFEHVFFVAGGGPAVDNAIKAAVDWKVRKNLAAGLGEIGKRIVYFENAFHGRTGLSLSATKSTLHKYQYFPRFDWTAVQGPPCESYELPVKQQEAAERQTLGAIRSAIERTQGDVAAVIIEPVQGEGGDVHWRHEFMRELRRLTMELDVMLIFDEVQTGCGTTGTRWAFEHWGEDAVPDLVAFGKKTQVCGFMSTRRIDEVADNVFAVSGRLDSTWTGNLTDYVRGRRILEIIEDDRLFENCAKSGEYMLRRLRDLTAHYPEVTRVRGKGLFVGASLPSAQLRALLVKNCAEEGLMILSCGTDSVRLRPALVLTIPEAELMVQMFRKALAKTFPRTHVPGSSAKI